MRHSAKLNTRSTLDFSYDVCWPEKVTKLQKKYTICDFSGKNHQSNGGPRFSTPQILQFKRALTPSLTTPCISPTNNFANSKEIAKNYNGMAESV